MDDLIVRLSADCPWPRGTCGARFEDLPPRRPPDLPGVLMRFRVLKGGSSPEEGYMTKDQWLVVVGILLTVIFGLAALITAKIVITAKTVRKRSQRQDIRSGGHAI